MNVLDEITEYLRDKVEGVNINNPKANSGATFLKLYSNWEEGMSDIVKVCIPIMAILFTRNNSNSPAGTAALTNMSMKIGKWLHRHIERDPITWRDELRLGDLIVEAFYNCGAINIDYPARRDSPHTVLMAARWHEINIKKIVKELELMNTTFTKPASIKGLKQDNGGQVIKRWSADTKLDLDSTFVRSINNLQQTPWRINVPVFLALQKEKGFISITPEKKKEREIERKSKKIEWDFIEAKAEKFIEDGRDFYQYISADYRGRLYYNETFLNFQGSDKARGILEFAEPKPMTENGKWWLAIHTASAFNESYDISEIPEWCEEDYASYLAEQKLESIAVDKMTLSDRVRWLENNYEMILNHGRDLTFSNIAEKRVSFLAACLEWYNIEKYGDDWLSCLPIGIDGSNNGWQHLGAISKDSETGELVGLVPVDIQRDFYVQTAKELINQTTDEHLMSILSEMPMKKIRKGISKRGSMTRAYSAGAVKIAENMFDDCKVEDYDEEYGITQTHCDKLSRLLIQAINIVCPGPLSTMAYFQALAAFEIGKTGIDPKLLARRKEINRLRDPSNEELEELNDISKELEEQSSKIVYGNGEDHITWQTPSGFNVKYENWTMNNFRCRGTISGYRQVNHVVQQPSDKPDIRGFMCGISPNFIHSMDASHMSLVIDEWNGTFGAVHDSFSTHACDVDDLLALTKSKFIEMYDVDNFYDYIENQLITNKTDLDVDQPDRGSLQIREIEDSDYFFA